MPLLCISLLALLLLPLALSCDTQKPREEVSEEYTAIIETLLSNTRENITTQLKNSNCQLRHKPQNCTGSQNQDFVSTLHDLSCAMRRLNLSETVQLADYVLQSIQCPCPQTKDLTKVPNVVTEEEERKKQKKHRRRMKKKLCKAEVILSNMTKCYQMINTIVKTANTTARSAPQP